MGKRRRGSNKFYDLNIDADDGKLSHCREVVAMALQLGLSGIAQNHVVIGNMVHADTCKIQPFDLALLHTNSSVDVAQSGQFHREVLGVPMGQPFRQYSRLTVVVDSPIQASALNAANPVLRSYDLVAVRPSNQKSFDQACTHLEVDLISLDLCHRLPFSLKAVTVKAAVERGVYFEIVYSQVFSNSIARRELFANAQVLQGLTCGRNIIVSSGARQAMELRGPNDIANMATFFGLSREGAKATISTNCEAVVLHGLQRKKTYKSSISVERCTQGGVLGSHEAWFDVPTVWDPLSTSGVCDFIPVTERSACASTLVHANDNLDQDNYNTKESKESVLHRRKRFLQEDHLFIGIDNDGNNNFRSVGKQGKEKNATHNRMETTKRKDRRKRTKHLRQACVNLKECPASLLNPCTSNAVENQ
eukprot:c24208_g1_i3 orf=18-1274(-)